LYPAAKAAVVCLQNQKILEETSMRILSALALAAGVVSAGAALAQPAAPAGPPPTPMTLTSSSFEDGGVIPAKYTGSVPSPVSPQLAWTNAPAATVSFALILHDVDTAPRKASGDILHWMAFNIPGTATSLPEGVPNTPTLADGTVQANALNRKPGFMAPAARGNVYHHYVFELFALDTKLDLGPDATRDAVLKAMDGHVVGKVAISGRSHL
jgi:Raf kinase inhibitor-like YbhB/YbcL family protein